VLHASRNACGGIRGWYGCRGWWAQLYCQRSCCLANALPTQEPPGTAPPPVCCHEPYPSVFNGNRSPLHLVVALCGESAEVLARALDKHPHYERVFVYSKCGADLQILRRAFRRICRRNTSVEIVPLPNVGGCDHTYLTHIFRHLGSDHSGMAPVTVFTQGRPDGAALCITHPLTVPASHAASGHAPLHGYDWQLKFKRRPLRAFSLDRRQHTFDRNGNQTAFVKSGFRNFGEWLDASLGKPLSEHLLRHAQRVVFGGYFSAEAWTLERYPRAMYRALLLQQVAPSQEVDHFIERLWGLLLSVPSGTALEHAILASFGSALSNVTQSPSLLADRLSRAGAAGARSPVVTQTRRDSCSRWPSPE